MKLLTKTILVLLSTIAISQAQSVRKVNRLVKEKEVKRIISTLAADNMAGRSAFDCPSIEKASVFLESEFAKIGLEKLPGLSSYRQSPDYLMLANSKLAVSVNGQAVAAENLLLSSENESVTFTGAEPIRYISKDKNFYAAYRNFAADSSSKIVIVAAEHKKIFGEIKGYFGKPKILTSKHRNPGNTLFVLTNQENPKVEVSDVTQSETASCLHNIVGVLPGKTLPNEYVIYSAHYDHIGLLATVNADSIANGADDDASGTTAVVSLAKLFKKLNNNARSIIFVAFTAEEIGGYGSKYFSKQLNPEQITAMVNIEMIGKASKWGKNAAFVTGFERSNLGTIMQQNLKGTPFALYPDPYPEQNLFYRSDNATLARLGVPAHSFSTDQIDSDALYHTVADEVQSLDMKNITATIKALALATKSIVAGTDTPSRIDKSQVH
jgi:hypothetical protein